MKRTDEHNIANIMNWDWSTNYNVPVSRGRESELLHKLLGVLVDTLTALLAVAVQIDSCISMYLKLCLVIVPFPFFFPRYPELTICWRSSLEPPATRGPRLFCRNSATWAATSSPTWIEQIIREQTKRTFDIFMITQVTLTSSAKVAAPTGNPNCLVSLSNSSGETPSCWSLITSDIIGPRQRTTKNPGQSWTNTVWFRNR